MRRPFDSRVFRDRSQAGTLEEGVQLQGLTWALGRHYARKPRRERTHTNRVSQTLLEQLSAMTARRMPVRCGWSEVATAPLHRVQLAAQDRLGLGGRQARP